MSLALWLRTCADLVFPPRCTFCDNILLDEDLGHAVCSECCATTRWLRGPLKLAHIAQPAWDHVHALCLFDGPVIEAVGRLKYGRRFDVAKGLGALLRAQVAQSEYDLITPVPLATWRLMRRGYNQSTLLARALAKSTPHAVSVSCLRRRYRRPQVGLGAAERLTNVRGSIRLGRHGGRVAGKRVLLIDDVVTTGATLHACAQVLRRAGAECIDALVVAQA